MAQIRSVEFEAPCAEFQIRYLDGLANVLPSSLVLWGDCASAKAWAVAGVPSPWEVDENFSFVFRKTTLDIVEKEALRRSGMDETVTVQVFLHCLGRTSFRLYEEVRKTKDKSLVAKIWSTCICVDNRTVTPIPVPNKEKLPVFHNIPEVPAYSTYTIPEEKPIYQWRSVVRITDCDFMNHINNTKYPLLAIEALAQAREAGAFDDSGYSVVKALSYGNVNRMHIEFIDQALPYKELVVSIWFHEFKKSFLMQFQSSGKVMSEIVVFLDGPTSNL